MAVYSATKFRKVFHVPLQLYCALHTELLDVEFSFAEQTDASGRVGRSSHQKILCRWRRLENGLSFEQLDDMSRMSPESQRAYFQNSLVVGVRRFGQIFLNCETELDELRNVILSYEESGFLGCFGCIDCMHMHWKTAQKRLKGSTTIPMTECWPRSLALQSQTGTYTADIGFLEVAVRTMTLPCSTVVPL